MKIILLFLSISVILISCVLPTNYGMPKNERIVGRLLQKVAKQLESKHKFQTIATNIGMPGGVVELLGLDFQICRLLTKEEARKMLIDCAEQLLSAINSDEELHPYLKRHPFTVEDISLIIFIVDKVGNDVYHPNIDTAQISRGILEYTTTDAVDTFTYRTRINESYEEALKAVKETRGP